MTTRVADRTQPLAWWLAVVAGMALLGCLSVAHARELPHNVKVIYINRPGYLNLLPRGPFSQEDIRDATALAELGDAQTQANLGVMFQSRGEYQKAVHWYQLAASAGVATAQYNMGTLYFNGEGVPKDYAKALEWFRVAAKRGSAYAEFQLGLMHFTGQGVAKDPARQIYWYKKAAGQGLAAAAYNLAVAYAKGEGVPADGVTAYAWMLLAERFSRKDSGIDANGALPILAANLSPAQIRQAEKLSHQLAGDPELPVSR